MAFVSLIEPKNLNEAIILGRPFMSTANCVVDMGKKKLEMGIEDQQISFDLFNEERKLPDQNVCLQVKVFDEKVLKERTKIEFLYFAVNSVLRRI